MNRYVYEGFDSLGCVKRGFIDAASIEDASGNLREMKIFVQSISPEGVRGRNILPDEKASDANFPAAKASSQPQEAQEDGGFVRIYEPTKAGQKQEPDPSEGRAKVYNPFAKEHEDAAPRNAQQQAPPRPHHHESVPGLSGFSGTVSGTGTPVASDWEKKLASDLQVAFMVSQAVGKMAPESSWASWAAQALVEQAAQTAAFCISKQRSS
jgi:hypothetical protein